MRTYALLAQTWPAQQWVRNCFLMCTYALLAQTLTAQGGKERRPHVRVRSVGPDLHGALHATLVQGGAPVALNLPGSQAGAHARALSAAADALLAPPPLARRATLYLPTGAHIGGWRTFEEIAGVTDRMSTATEEELNDAATQLQKIPTALAALEKAARDGNALADLFKRTLLGKRRSEWQVSPESVKRLARTQAVIW